MDLLLTPFLSNGFMLQALIAGVLVSIACAIVGTFIILRGLAFIGDALAHGVDQRDQLFMKDHSGCEQDRAEQNPSRKASNHCAFLPT